MVEPRSRFKRNSLWKPIKQHQCQPGPSSMFEKAAEIFVLVFSATLVQLVQNFLFFIHVFCRIYACHYFILMIYLYNTRSIWVSATSTALVALMRLMCTHWLAAVFPNECV